MYGTFLRLMLPSLPIAIPLFLKDPLLGFLFFITHFIWMLNLAISTGVIEV